MVLLKVIRKARRREKEMRLLMVYASISAICPEYSRLRLQLRLHRRMLRGQVKHNMTEKVAPAAMALDAISMRSACAACPWLHQRLRSSAPSSQIAAKSS